MRLVLPRAVDPVDAMDVYGDLPVAPGRPGVRVNMVATVDGATAVEGRAKGLASEADRHLFHLMRSLADVIMVGAETMRAERYRPAAVPIAVVSRSCAFDWSSPFFREASSRPIVLTVAQAPEENVQRARELADVVVVGDSTADAGEAVAELGRRGFRHVLCEGGPTFNAHLARARVLDELCLTVSPLLAGGQAKRVLAGADLLPHLPLVLVSLCEEDGSLFFRYRLDPRLRG